MIYVSYSLKDKPAVQRVCRSLIEKGVQLFMDYEQLAGGVYAQELTKQIELAEAILLFYSENTENSTWVKHEIEFSLSKNKYIIPLLLSEPEENSWLNFHLGAFNWIKVDGEDINSIADRIINAFGALCQKDKGASMGSTENTDESDSTNTPQSGKKEGDTPSRRKKIFICGFTSVY